jgi:sialate O-acetylesterase
MEGDLHSTVAPVTGRRGTVGLALILCWTSMWAQRPPALSPLFTDHMVVQRGKSIPVWGTAAEGRIVRVSLGGSYGSTLADHAGRWTVGLDPLVAGGPYDLIVLAGDTLIVHDVAVGEIWFYVGEGKEGGGRSPTRGTDVPFPGVNPLVRFLAVERSPSSVERLDPIVGEWRVDGGVVGDRIPLAATSFARLLQERLGVPVGMVLCTTRGSIAESWVPEDSLASASGAFLHSRELLTPGRQTRPGVFFQGTVVPLTHLPLRGVLWDQADGRIAWPADYARVLSSLIGAWRSRWKCSPLWFFLVQLSTRTSGVPEVMTLPFVREAQETVLRLPQTGMAVTSDMRDLPVNAVGTEIEVGRRLALLARHRVYGEECEDSGPTFRSMLIPGESVVVRFDHDRGGLVSTTGATVTGFAVAGKERVFYPAQASILSGSVVLFNPEIPRPVAVRYGWDPAMPCTLYNREFLPAVPFRTDRWEDAGSGAPGKALRDRDRRSVSGQQRAKAGMVMRKTAK